jgi:glycosyltransferase involved in cell wall biosynthesis
MPGSGGEVRSYFFIKMLAEFSDLTLVCLGGPSGQSAVEANVASLCSKVIQPGKSWKKPAAARPSRGVAWLRAMMVIAAPWKNNWRDFYHYCMQYVQDGSREGDHFFQSRKRLLQSTLRFQYRMGARLFSMPSGLEFAYRDKFDAIKQLATDELAKGAYDLFWYEHSHGYPFVKELLGALDPTTRPKLACNAHNVEWLLYQRISDTEPKGWSSEYARIQARLLSKSEVEQFKQCDLVVVCSKEDKRAAMQLAPDARLAVIGNGVDSCYFSPAKFELCASTPTILFTGTFGYQPNLDGLKYFVEEVLPLIKAEVPGCRFIFAGREAQRAYDGLGVRDEHLDCVSDPVDIRPSFTKSWVFVVPLRSGGGTRLKILEAMSMQRPVVSTRIGAEGIPAEDGRHLLIADSTEEFAGHVVRLIRERELRTRMALEASSWVRQNYSWSLLGRTTQDELNALLA